MRTATEVMTAFEEFAKGATTAQLLTFKEPNLWSYIRASDPKRLVMLRTRLRQGRRPLVMIKETVDGENVHNAVAIVAGFENDPAALRFYANVQERYGLERTA
jgi:hypothetical protein